ncbi:2-(1,2-epoxy-1,2-dihydrophenyl)acetyl-CoA isomerase [Nocardioides terrae]|uniref:2-(1,2-epoxy-1,2-dihydrophenyl)acetyl-CoA isomerase n=1 Tax=Nocardioides terrae TaxID=574651 RepID=A0A1I1EE42_9ACTN|nr:enoyl-CoA hydratase-related protein [Nocardioides terrae]SFB85385.1 2-(1,2-epoxy-1,2-dihydrophenyl)acetyl-CoA isomerase [Nocardioides terrae]
MTDRVGYELRDGAARITLVDGDRGNTLTLESGDALLAAVRRARTESARVIVLRATGRFFSAGGDIGTFADLPDVTSGIDDLAEVLHRIVSELIRGDAVVVSAVHGVAAGAGFPLAAAADVVLAAESARFTLGYTKLGFSVDGGSSLLVHTLGLHRALRLALLNDVLTAAEAHAAGLVARVVPDAELAAVTEHVVAGLLAGPAAAQADVKRLFREVAEPAPESALRRETLAIRRNAAAPDGREGVSAFLEKRPPRFNSGL